MVWKKDDFGCDDCGAYFDELYKADELDDVVCPECGSYEVDKILSAPNLGTYSMMSPEHQKASMLKRSYKHTQKELDKEPERWGSEGKARATKKIQSGYKRAR
jgi:putative FmdB family regulatory protein